MLYFILVIVIIGSFFVITDFKSPPTTQSSDQIAVSCFVLEADTKITINQVTGSDNSRFSGKTYLRIRKDVGIPLSKVPELQKVGQTKQGEDVYWLGTNFKADDLQDFVYLLTRSEPTLAMDYFDLYIDQTKKDNIPDFIKDCKETINNLVVVPVQSLADPFPPAFFSLTDSDFNKSIELSYSNSGFETNFNQILNIVQSQYFIRSTKELRPEVAKKVGIMNVKGDSGNKTYEVFYHASVIFLTEDANDSSQNIMYIMSGEKPVDDTSGERTIQLKTVKFVNPGFAWTWATPSCKPAIYLYSENEGELNIKLNPQGVITKSIPDYNPGGWNVITSPDGNITSIDRQSVYPYLYYEADVQNVVAPKDGWIVNTADFPAFFNSILPKLGLNKREQNDFTDYWLGKLNERGFYFVGLFSQKQLDKLEDIKMSIKPDQFIRIRFYFEKLDNYPNIGNFDNKIEKYNPNSSNWLKISFDNVSRRSGFVAVDWGGMIENGNCGVSIKSE